MGHARPSRPRRSDMRLQQELRNHWWMSESNPSWMSEPVKRKTITAFLPCEFILFCFILFLAVSGGSLPRGCKFACMIHFHLLPSSFCWFIPVNDVQLRFTAFKRGCERAFQNSVKVYTSLEIFLSESLRVLRLPETLLHHISTPGETVEKRFATSLRVRWF